MQFWLRGATVNDYNNGSIANIVSTYGGKIIQVIFVRNSSGNPAVYINGVAQTVSFGTNGTPPTWQGTVTSTNLVLGGMSGEVSNTQFFCASLYNLALSAADALELFELGGAVPYRFQFGTTALYTSDFSVNADGWLDAIGTTTITGNTDGINAQNDWLAATKTANSVISIYKTAMTSAYSGKAIRAKVRVFVPIGSTASYVGWYFNNSSNTANPATAVAANNQYDLDAVWVLPFGIAASPRNGLRTTNAANSADVSVGNGESLYFKNIVWQQVGAICHFNLEDGISRQIRDSSVNNAHAISVTSGVTHLAAKDDGRYQQTALTANGELLDTDGLLPIDAVLVDVVVKNTTANAVSGFALAMTSGSDELTNRTDIPASSVVTLPIKRTDLAGLTVGTTFGRCYYSALSWNSGSLNIAIRYRRERDL